MKVCLECKTQFEKTDEYGECPKCGSSNKSHLEQNEYENIMSFKDKVVLFKGNTSKEPSYAIFKGFNKWGWSMFEILNTQMTVFGNAYSFMEINDKNIVIFKKMKLEYSLKVHKKMIKQLKKDIVEKKYEN